MTLAFLVFLLIWLVGVVGTFIPVVPATLLIFVGSVVATFIDGFQFSDFWFLLGLGTVSIAIGLVDNLTSIWGTRKYGGSKRAAWGAFWGSIVGLVLPMGLIVGPLGGAFLVEMYLEKKPVDQALRSAWGTLVGLLTGIAAKLVLHILVGIYELNRLWDPARALF
ncbi:DUF456 domain-containing protein [Deinococcus roseus]|uniref:DUF456 domain-containing protein n=1 Tax=Deinococcus roseus TaxID=392414 RepID=A0ABQ2D157_9DEIO|nr:DUF456 family protein [Deinococcus roseus]GGJ36241.1 hypothetical protein GCM10008938_22920 [Deinococcus roseus]